MALGDSHNPGLKRRGRKAELLSCAWERVWPEVQPIQPKPPELPTSAPDSLRQHLVNYLAVNIRESPIRAVVAESKLLMIDTEEVQHRGMEIVIACRSLRR